MGRLETDRIREQTTGDDYRPNPQAMDFPPHRTGATAACGFIILYAAAHHLTGDYRLFGLSNDAVRSAAHFCGYGALALLLSKALFNQYLLVWIISLLRAIVEEIHQIVVPYRCACLEDWGINVAGIIRFSSSPRLSPDVPLPNAPIRRPHVDGPRGSVGDLMRGNIGSRPALQQRAIIGFRHSAIPIVGIVVTPSGMV